ncbi:MAG: zinc ribbon domain-containing protein [Oscillospiraceae bacterium]|jgi:hypothetical protein|nr:zinc ribbon domain-containing protein [Oscillospiraceae bacterium]
MANSCPKCGGELPAGTTVCTNCGANANAKPDVDNSAEISKMFAGGGDSGLSDSQIADFESGKAVELGGSLSELDGALSAMNDINFDEILGNGTEVPPGGPLPGLEPSPLDFKNEKPDDDDNSDDIIIQKGVTEVHGFRLPRIVQRIIACIVILAIGFGAGYGLKYFQEQGVFSNYTNEISLKSLRTVTALAIPAEYNFKAVEIFVKRDAITTECIIFGVLSTEAGGYIPTYFRLTINNNDLSDATLFFPFDPVRHEELLASDDVQDRLDAGTMMNRYETYLLSLAEINSGNPRWVQADIEFVNRQLAREG